MRNRIQFIAKGLGFKNNIIAEFGGFTFFSDNTSLLEVSNF